MARSLVLGILGIYSWFKIGSLQFYALSLWIEGGVWMVARFFDISPRRTQWFALFLSFAALIGFLVSGEWKHALLRVFLVSCFRSIFRLRGVKGAKAFPLLLTLVIDLSISGFKAIDEGSILFYLLVTFIHVSPWGTPWWKISLRISILFQAFSLFQFHTVQLLTPILGLLIFPWMVGIGFLVPWLKENTMKFTLWIFDQFPSTLVIPSNAIWTALVASGVMIVLPRKKEYVGAAVLLLLLIRLIIPLESRARVIQWDVGQGDSALLEKKGRRVIVDVGSARGHYEREWWMRLTQTNAHHVDEILLTHLDEDHAGALMRILPLVNVNCIHSHQTHWSSSRGSALREWIETYFPKTRITTEPCTSLFKIAWFSSNSSRAKGNAMMAGFRFELDSQLAYFAIGDGDQNQELQYLREFRADIESHSKRIWKVSHHGSRYSSSPRFLEEVTPDECWISVGEKNSYRHPHPFALHRLMRFCKRIMRTDLEGDLSVFGVNDPLR